MFLWIIQRDLLLAMRRRADVLTTLFFFIIVVSLFPLGVGPEMNMLRTMAPGVVWVAALLASMLSLGRMFSSDHVDGTLEQMLLSPQSLSLLVLGKALAHWLVTGVPLVLMAPVLGIQYDLVGGCATGADRLLVAGNTRFESDRRHRRGADSGIARWRRAGIAAGIAALYPGIDIWRGCGGSKRGGPGGWSAHVAAGRVSAGISGPGAMDGGRIITDFHGVRKLLN